MSLDDRSLLKTTHGIQPPGRTPAHRLALARPVVTPTVLLLLVVAYVAITQNRSFVHALMQSLPQPFGALEWRVFASAIVALLGLLTLALAPFAFPRSFKPAAIVFLLAAAIASYFMDAFGVVIDRSMMQNALNTDRHEAADLMHWAFLSHVAVQGVLPAWLVGRMHIRYGRPRSEVGRRAALVAGVLVALAAIIALQFNALALWGREHRDVRLYVNPTYPLYAGSQLLRELLPAAHAAPLNPVALDARRLAAAQQRPLQVVLVVGETARADHFQLNGYARPTTPQLAGIDGVIDFPSVSSCGTATAESVPCMFSRLGRAQYSHARARGQENLLDVLERAGVDVDWRDNNSGCQGVCARTGTTRLDDAVDPVLCSNGECLDDILLRDLGRGRPAVGAARLLVLHQKGSHGPAYFKRYPTSARVFVPDCHDENVQRCTQQEIVNAYDNTIAYTDHFLAGLIRELERDDAVDSVVLYVSDHGESLGEHGIYLHGLPYRLAPDAQTHVPMLAWFSDGARRTLGLDLACVRAARAHDYSHDNLFPTVLGLLGVVTADYDRERDIFAACRTPTLTANVSD